MVGSIDPRCEKIRGTHRPAKVAGMFGTRVAENHLGQRLPTASTGRTYGCKRSDQTVKNLLWHGGRPHMGPGLRRDDKTRVPQEFADMAVELFLHGFVSGVSSHSNFENAGDSLMAIT